MASNWKQYLGILRSQYIYYGKPWQQKRMTQFYRQFIGPNDLCFDVGAHLGNRTKSWRQIGARVIAIEPQPQCIDFLQRHFGADPSVNILPKAIGRTPGQLPFYVSELTPTVSTMSQEWFKPIKETTAYTVKWDTTIQVAVVTLDQLLEQYGLPQFCKIDVENYEVEVLAGLSQAIPCLSFEYYQSTIPNALQCIDLLSHLGNYEFNWTVGADFKFHQTHWENAKTMKALLQHLPDGVRAGDVYAREGGI